jgi:hypothetical protein
VVLAALACTSGVAAAATPNPAVVTVRVEGATTTLLPPTVVTTQAAAFHPANDPAPSHTCSGTSAAHALEMATGGTWNGTYSSSSSDYTVNSILGEIHPTGPADASVWSFWVNDAPATLGICQQQLTDGDQILFFPECRGTAACSAGASAPSVLSLSAPTVVQSGTLFTAGVASFPNTGGTPTSLAGATISADGVTAVTGAGGQAAITLTAPGSYLLSATAPNAVRTESVICVHNGNDGNCGTPKSPASGSGAGSTAPPTATNPISSPLCATNGADGLCGTIDKTPPIARLQIPEGRHYGHGKGPRELNGTVAPDPSGIKLIRLRLTRRNDGNCQVYSAKSASLLDGPCSIDDAPWFTVGPPTPFSYLLKKHLPTGRYVLDVQASDGAGNHQTTQVPGRSRIVFRVG